MSVVAFIHGMLAAGFSHEDALRAAEVFEAEAVSTVDAQAERRREKDRDRQAERRARLRTSADSADSADVQTAPLPLSPSPQTPQPHTPTPGTDTSRTRKGADPRPSKRCPEDWTPSDADLATVEREGLNLNPTEVASNLAAFRDHTFGTARVDWSATFRNWLREADRRKPKPRQNHAEPDRRHTARLENYAASSAGADRAAEVLAARREF